MVGENNTSPVYDSSQQVVRRLAKIRLLKGVPFQYLIPTDAALPVESIRFFHIDQNWLDALIDGALSVTMRSKSDIEWIKGTEEGADSNRYESILKDTNQFSSSIPVIEPPDFVTSRFPVLVREFLNNSR